MGRFPSRYGYSVQSVTGQLRTSLGMSPQQSKHFARIALSGRRGAGLVVPLGEREAGAVVVVVAMCGECPWVVV